MDDTTEVKPTASPELTAKREELDILHSIFNVMGNATIRAHECKRAGLVLDYVQAKIDALEADVKRQAEAEEESKAMSEAVLQAMRTPAAEAAP